MSEPQGGREATRAGVSVKSVLSRRDSESRISAVEVHKRVQCGCGGGGRNGGRLRGGLESEEGSALALSSHSE